jgi:hypothetical protein
MRSTRLPLPLGIALAAALSCLASGCDRQAAPEAPPAPQPVAAPAAAPAAPAAPAASGLRLEFTADSGAIGTQVGVRVPGMGLASNGKAGWLVFGPYASLPPGRYRARMQGAVLPGHAGHVHVDVATAQGAQLLAAMELEPADVLKGVSGADLFIMDFTVSRALDDVEVRAKVDEGAKLGITRIYIDALP